MHNSPPTIIEQLKTFTPSDQTVLKIFGPLGVGLIFLALSVGVKSWWFNLVLTIIVGLSALVSFRSIYQKFKNIFPWIRGLFHLIVAYCAFVLAHFSVSNATGLPPKDFDLTVTLMAGLLYVPIWFLIVALALTLTATTQALYLLVLQIITTLFNPIKIFDQKKPNAFNRWISKKSEEAQALNIRFIGTLTLAIASASFGTIGDWLSQQTSLVRWVAYWTDYQTIPNYPCFAKKQRVRLHENGVTSIATRHGTSIEIESKTIDITKCNPFDKE